MEKKYFFKNDYLQIIQKTYLSLILLLTCGFLGNAQTFNTPGADTWTCPPGVTSVTVECWGAGGGGQRVTGNPANGGGGSGGGYVKTIYTVTPGNTYNLFVGTGGTAPGSDGQSSWFVDSATLLAIGGNGAGPTNNTNNTWGSGASAPSSGNIGGTLVNSYGGDGGNATSSFSGGGGSSAGSSASNDAIGINGGNAPIDGFSGGNGRNSNGTGFQGNIGAGGGGGFTNINTNFNGGNGGNGRVRIRFSSITSFTPTFACSDTGTIVTITGTELNGTTSVTFNGIPAVFTVDSNTQITATLPNGATSGLISMTTPFGTASSPTNFTVNPSSIGGTIAGGNTPICLGNSTGVMSLTGYVGTIIRWEYQVNGGGWTNTGVNTPTYNMTPFSLGTWEYRVLVQNGSCPNIYSLIRTITVDPIAVGGSITGGTTPICVGQSTGTMTLGGGYSGTIVRWEKRLLPATVWTSIANTTTTYSENPASAGTWEYRVLISSGSCPQVYSTVFTVDVNPRPTISLGANPIVCQGSTTALLPFSATFGSPDIYIIDFNGAANGAGFLDQTLALGSAPGNITIPVPISAPIGVYSGNIRVQNSITTCTSVAYSFTVSVSTIVATPSIPTPSATVICQGSSPTNYTTSSPNALSYNWTVSGAGNTISGTGTTATVTWAPGFSGTATVSVSANGCNTSGIASTNVTVTAAPTVTNNATYVVCNNTTLNIPLTASVPSNFTWVAANNPNVGGESTTNQANNTISNTLTNVTNTAQTVVYTVTPTATTGGCVGTPQTISVTVNPTATVTPPTNLIVCSGTTVSPAAFTSPQTPAASVTYTWTNSNPAIGLAASGSGNLPSFSATNPGTTPLIANITVTPFYDGCPGTPYTLYSIRVNPTPTVNAVADQTRCRGTNTATINFTGAVTGTTYSWTNNNTAIGLAANGSGTSIGSFTTINTGNTPLVATITVTPTANSCPGTPITFTITVNPTPTVNAVANLTNICNGSLTPAVNFTGNNVPGVVYNWTNNTPSIGLPAAGSGNIAPFTAINTGAGTITATITVIPTANGCPGTSRTFTYTILPSPIVNAVTDRVYCHAQGNTGTGISFGNNVGTGGTYNWTSSVNVGFGLSGSGNIGAYNPQNTSNAPITSTVSVTYTRNGCTGPATTFTITVNPRPTVDAITNLSYCNNEVTSPINFTSPVAGTTFTWSYTGGNIGLPLSGNGNIPSFTTVNTGTVDVVRTFTVLASANGCNSVAPNRTFTITVRPSPIVPVIANQTRCHDQGTTGTGVTFTNNLGATGATYAWTSTVDVGFGFNGSGNIPAYNPQNPGTTPIVTTVSVVCTRNGCAGPASTFTITVNPRPIITVLADYCAVPGKVQLVASSNIPGTTWSWNTTPPQTTSTIDVDIAGTYTATGTVNGCSSSGSISVAQELVVNGDFTDGNVGFFTDYMYLPDLPFVNNELVPDTGNRGYGVGTNANNYHPNFWGIDHTNNAVGPRNMMIVNGKGGSLTLWQQTVNVEPNTDYYFSGWGMSVNPASPASLRFEVNGVQVGVTANLGAAPTNAAQALANNYWIRFYSDPVWNSGALSGPIIIRIVNLNPSLGGNDFAIDDISFGTLSTFVNLTSVAGTDNQTLCRNTPINDITYSVGSGIAGPTITGLPPGVTSTWNGVTLRINGSPTAAGTYNYTITTTGSCLPATATGTIIVQPSPETPTTVTVTQPTCIVATGSIAVSSTNGIYYSIDGVNYSNVSGVFSGLAPGTYNITTRNDDNLCASLALTVVIVPQVINTWNGTTWSNGTPIITDTVVFNGNYNQSVDFQGCSCTVNSGNVVIPAGNTVTITNWVNVAGGTLTFENNSSLVQINNVANTGNITYRRSATNIQGQDYIYWSSPVTNQNLNTIYTTPAQGQKYIWNTTTNNGNGTGGNISQGNWEPVDNVIMQAARGYIVRGSNDFTMPATTINSTFIGVPRNGNITTSIARGQYTGSNYFGLNGIQITNLDDNWNLIGNPYPSAINALQFLSDNSANILGNVRLWKHGIDISNLATNPYYGSFGYNYSSSDYEIINFTGTTTPGFNEIIKTGQAFFVQMIDGPGNAVGSVSFNNAQRNSNYANDNFFRVSAENTNEFNSIFTPERHRIWLDIVNSNNASTGTLVGYVAGATMEVDANFDAYDKPVGDMRIFSSIADNTYTIQGRSLPFNQNDMVPLVVVTPATGVYNIAIRAVDGLFENSSQNIYLEDTMLGTIHDLKLNPYTFTSIQGTHNDRFVLRYTNETLNLPSFETNDNVFAYTNDNVWVKSIENNIKDIVVYDLLGKKVDEYRNVNANEIKLKNLMPRKMVYILRITLENDVIVNKKIIF